MHDHNIIEMLDALAPSLKSKRKAEALLRGYWSDKIALIWSTEDVHRAANERETVLTQEEARTILTELHEHHTAQYGLQWKDLYDAIENSGFGRDITKRELSRFVHKDIIAIQRSSRSKKVR
jgi:hypothetical protein